MWTLALIIATMRSRIRWIVYGLDPDGLTSLWVQVKHDGPVGDYRVNVVATGQEFDSEKWTHCKTWAQGPFIWHLMIEIDDIVDENARRRRYLWWVTV